ncbi:MAG: polyphosphate kinase 1 [Capsulimonadales bacterium]|nr:polyphosphate kinase 1 [Capsulimonadales bacterium]
MNLTEQNLIGERGAATPSVSPGHEESGSSSLYFNRELSWLEFNKRVLEEAQDERNPLLERVKFLAIFHSNLDEFYMIRISGPQAQRKAGVHEAGADGLTPAEALLRINARVTELYRESRACYLRLFAELKRERIFLLPLHELPASDHTFLSSYFLNEIFPILTPLAVDPGHPFPHISNLSLNLAIVLRDESDGERFARMKVPGTLPRLIELPVDGDSHRFVRIEDVIEHHLKALFPGEGLEPVAVFPFRVTRNADIEIQEGDAADLLELVQEGVRRRHFEFVTRLEIGPHLPERIRQQLLENLEMTDSDTVVVDGEMGLSSLMELTRVDRPDLKFEPHIPHIPGQFSSGEDIFDVLTRQDVLLHHPYDSFAPVIQLVERSARDPHVRAIKQTLYRLGSNSPLVPALIEARDADTQVAVLVELKARFDEENNIQWARRLEEAGVHVVYGLIGLKTHCKVTLVVRRESGGIRRYLHLGTGNYNATTARIYTDFSLLTADPELGADATDLFNYLTGYSRQRKFRKMLVAPVNLRQELTERIDRETERARDGKPARLIFKMNSLTDIGMIDHLYRASRAGVRVDLIVRGVCSLRPGIPGVSENIEVISIVGRFLEHARIYYFENAGSPELYLGSADLMTRNLDRRVEVLFPISDPPMRERIVRDVLQVQLADNVQARRLLSDGTWERIRPEGRKKRIDAQTLFLNGGRKPVRRRNTP